MIRIRRLRVADYPAWRPLARASRREQGVPGLTNWRTPWPEDPYVWGIERDGVLIGYVTWADATRYMAPSGGLHPSLARLEQIPRWAILDLYLVPCCRGKEISAGLIRDALIELGIGESEPIALSRPVQEAARRVLKAALGEDRVVVGFYGAPGRGPVWPGTIDEIVKASENTIKTLKERAQQRQRRRRSRSK